MAEVASDVVSVRWSDAIFVLGLTDVSGLKEAAVLQVNGQRAVTVRAQPRHPDVSTRPAST